MKYLFYELLERIEDTQETSLTLDPYFAINRLPEFAFADKSLNKEPIQAKINLSGTLYDSLHNPAKFTTILLTIPGANNSLSWTVTDDQGRFVFNRLDFFGLESCFFLF